ncbi:zinc-finger domain-containing protein [Azospirillum ramasamyi]|uniref:Zinc-finger domain-containing protein n=1 Tax=Azospirillum ramasamyi TaxID=682998 RepID=A0A2U9SAC3_9PROT|nr:zinc-finger domain-containing protein [Azospirillum ramasamyi]AWU96392.1 zinc-finger domain-containing protein [Azospirillum ramasamyi]
MTAMQPTETILVETSTVGCDGGGGALGHPLVYLTLDGEGQVECPYCSRIFKLKEGAKVAHGH